MKHFCLLLTSVLVFCSSCHKDDHSLNADRDIAAKLINGEQAAATAETIYNPIIGKWELSTFKILCSGVSDTTIYWNERGDFVEFRKTDTAFYTYKTTNATGWSPYKILDASRFILGDTVHIVSFNGVHLTTYTKSMNGGSQQWMTYKKVDH